MPEPVATETQSRGTIRFNCASCGLPLEVHAGHAGVSGPCPGCSAWITSPFQPSGPSPAKEHRIPSQGSSQPSRQDGSGKGRISADTLIDHAHIEQRETAQTLKILILFILVACACVAVAWFLSAKMGE